MGSGALIKGIAEGGLSVWQCAIPRSGGGERCVFLVEMGSGKRIVRSQP